MADTDYISVRRLRTFLAQMKQWVLGFAANRNTQAMSDVTKDTGISGTVAIGKSITIHTASGAQTANVMNADMIVDEKPTTNKDLASKAPTINLVDSMVMEAVSDAFDDITTIEYQSVNNAGKLPQEGQAGVIYLCSVWEEVENPTGNPHDLGYYVYTNGEYVLTTDTSVQSGTTYYTKAMATDEYIWLASESRYEPLGQAKVDLTGLLFAGSATSGGTAYKAAAIPFGRVDSTSTSTKFTASVEGITALEDGVCCYLTNDVVTSASGFTLNINGLGAKPVYTNLADATRDTTIFNKVYTMLFVYNSTRVSGGCWDCYRGYDSNTNTIGYQLRTNNGILKTTDAFRYYKVLFTSADNTHWVPASVDSTNNATSARAVNQRPINPFGPIVYCHSTSAFAANADVTATAIWQQYAITLGYSFNRTGAALALTTKAPVYIKCTPQSDGSAIIDADTPYVQTLPTTEDGKIYIYFGIAYSATAVELRMEHPVFYYKGGAIRVWVNQAQADVSLTNDTYNATIGINGTSATVVSTSAIQGAEPSSISDKQVTVPNWAAISNLEGTIPHNLHVQLTSSTSGGVTTYTADHTHAEIVAALASGGVVDVEYEAYLYAFDGDIDGDIYFHRVSSKRVSNPNSSDNVYDHMFYVSVVNGNDVWTLETPTELIDNATTSRTGVVQLNNTTTSTSTTQAATANAVHMVADMIPTTLSDLGDDASHRLVTDDEKTTWNAKVGKVELDKYNSDATESSEGTPANGQTDVKVDNVSIGTVVTSYAPGTAQRPYVAPSWHALNTKLSDKQDTISDLATIRSGASKGSTAIQPTDIRDELDPGGNGEIADSAAIAAYIEEKAPTKPTTSTDNAIARYDGTSGNLQNSGVTINDSNHVTAAKFITSGGTNKQFVKGDGSLDDTEYMSQKLLDSRGENLIYNGNGFMGDNTNFKSFTFDPSECNGSPGSFKYTSYGAPVCTFPIPINPSLTYMFRIDGKQDEQVKTFYALFRSYDVDGYEITPEHYYWKEAEKTELTQDLVEGDTVIHLANISAEWLVTTGGGRQTNINIWNYKNEQGYTYPPYTYTRNYLKFGSYDNIDRESNTITLSAPYSGETIPAGTKVSRRMSGGTYLYLLGGIKFGSDWESRTVLISGINTSGSGDGNSPRHFRPGTATVKLGFLINYSGASTQTTWLTNISFSANDAGISLPLTGGILTGGIEATSFKKTGGTSSQFLKADGSVDSNTYLTSHQDISGKVDKNAQGIADGTQHSTTTDTTQSTLVTIGTQSGSQSANLVPHEVVTGNITGTPATDKNTIPTSAAVAQYVSTNSPAPIAGDGIDITGSTISLKTASTSEVGGIKSASVDVEPNIYKVTVDASQKTAEVPIPNASASKTGVLTKEDFATFSGKQDALTFDPAPTINSTRPVTSGGVYEALEQKADKSDTYTKTEVNNLVSTIHNDVIIGALPSTGVANKIYRVPGTNSYADYAWDGTQFVKLAEFEGSIFMQLTEAQYDALSDTEKNNGTWYFIEEE